MASNVVACGYFSRKLVSLCVSGRLVKSLIGVRHLTQEAGKSGPVKETPEDTSQPPTQNVQADDEREETEYQTKQRILKAALPFVLTYGWTKHAIAKGAEAEGMPGVAHGLFQRGGVELVFYFYLDCNQRLVEQMSARVRQQQEQKESMLSISGLIQDAVEQRLRMNIPYIDKWQQAMAIQALPQNAPEALSNLAALVDDIWHYAGDQSTDFNWYTKRASLAGVYKSTEIYMLQDKSEDFQNTWEFLNRRMGDLKNFGKFARSVQENSVVISEGLYGMCIMARNVLGINARTR
ncbi:hypothetical protein CHS0354_032367 [Potamilus streckersoni]|uniref:Ubiquinone biosynthesis protein n=1 Tax=Potamilus streckersoni TaxID=2493646 RepID=A0AAE0WE42_9BIVA|nr:hypothetical protein CHS0354_032367 [Potamilus streckersoni]